jgi:ABC-type sugar transport system ATPase subunit
LFARHLQSLYHPDMAAAAIRLDNLSKVFPGNISALRELSLEVRAGEYLVLVGPSGCGKTTTLRLIAGLETPTAGRVFLDGKDVEEVPPHRRELAMVFQEAALYPHLSVKDNLGFGLRLQRLPAAVIAERVQAVARLLGLESLSARRPDELSGGERRRVALGRALVRQPTAVLLDEPLASLDAPARAQLRADLAALHRQSPTTTLHVTHDQEEALSLGERVAVLNHGVLQQIASPLELYERPANVFVAGFIGSPPMNFFPREREGLPCLLGLRPRDITLTSPDAADVEAVIESVEPLGHETILGARSASKGENSPITVVVQPGTGIEPGERVGLRFNQARMHWFDCVTQNRLAPNG